MKLIAFVCLGLLLTGCSEEAPQGRTAPITENTIRLYATSWCNFCEAARNYMDANDIDYVEYDIESDVRIAAEHRKLLAHRAQDGKTGVPLFVVRGNVILGYDQRRFPRQISALGIPDVPLPRRQEGR